MTFWINTSLGILSLLLWGGLILVYNRERFFPWLANKLARDRPPEQNGESLVAGPDFWPFNKDIQKGGEAEKTPLAPDVSALYDDAHYVLRCHATTGDTSQEKEATQKEEEIGEEAPSSPHNPANAPNDEAAGKLTGQFIIISFHDLGNDEYFTGTFPGIDIARTLGLDWISILPKTDSWYRLGDYTKALIVARDWVKARQAEFPDAKIIAYGPSMGGYAALKYAKFLQSDAVLALTPQWSIDPEEIAAIDPEYKSRFSSFFHPDMAQQEQNGRMGITAEDVSGQLYSIFDPDDRHDRAARTLLTSRMHITTLPWCFGGDSLVKQLQTSDYFQIFLQNLADPQALFRATAIYRRINKENILQILITTLARKKPALTVMVLQSKRFEDSGARNALVTSHPNLARRIVTILVDADYGQNVPEWLKAQPVDPQQGDMP